MAVTTKKTFNAVGSGGQSSTTVFTPVSIELNNQDDLDVYVTLSGGTRVLQYRQSTGGTTDSNHPQVNDTTGLYFPAQNTGVTLYNYTLSTDNNTITFNSALPSGAVVSVERRTRDSSSDYTNFVGGSTIRHTDVNRAFDESNFTAQEARNKAFELEGKIFGTEATSTSFITSDEIVDGTIVGSDISTDTITASNLAANSVGSSELADNAVDTNAIQDNAVTLAKIAGGALPTDITIASANIVDGTIVNADIASGAAIAHSKLSGAAAGKVLLGNSSNVVTATTVSGDVTINSSGVTSITAGSIVTGDIAADQITNALIADNQIDSEHYVDGSIDHEHLANDVIDGDNIQDDVINSEHIAAGAVDLEHMSANSVDSDQYVDGSIDRVHLEADIIDSTKLADNAVNSEHYVDGSIDHIHLANDIIDGDNIQDDVVNSEHIAAGALDNEHYAAGSITSDKLNAATVVTNSEQASASANDTSFFTTSASDARYFNVSTGDTIKDGDAFPDNDTTIATTAAINDRIIDLVDDVGGFVPIANETSFPNANPDVNNGTGTLVSIKALSSNLTSNGSGVATIANGTVGNSTVTITGLANSTTYAATFGMIVETTTTLNTYTFHRQVPIATEVSTVAGSISNVNTVAGDISNVNAVAGNATNINAVAGNASNINSAVSNASNINSAVSNASNINSAVSNASNINTTAGSISNVNTVAGSISNVNSVASNIGTVNDFAARYRTGANNPTDSLDTGDLFFNTSANELKVYNGSSWQGGVTASGNFASVTGNTFTGDNLYNDSVKAKFGTDSDFQAYHDNTNAYLMNQTGTLRVRGNDIRLQDVNGETYIKNTQNGSVNLYYDNALKLETLSNGVQVWGHLRIPDSDGTNDKLQIGNGQDLQIYHDGSNSYLDNSTGNLYLRYGSDNGVKVEPNAKVQLFYDGSKKLETTSGGVTIPNTLTVSDGANLDGDVKFEDNGGTTDAMMWDKSESSLKLNDNTKIQLGDSQDLKILHDGTHSYVTNTTGNLYLKSPNLINLRTDSNEIMIRGTANGSAELRYDASVKIETTSTGVDITGHVKLGDNSRVYFGDGDDMWIGWNGSDGEVSLASGALYMHDDIVFYDDKQAKFGSGGDLQIFHNTNDGIIRETERDLFLINTVANGQIIQKTDGNWLVSNQNQNEYRIKAFNDGKVELYFDNSKKLDTNSGGVKVYGNIDIDDSNKLRVGTSSDLQIYHNGTASYITSTSSTLYIQSTTIDIGNGAGTEPKAKFHDDGAVELYYDGSKKLETYSGGVSITGNYLFHGDAVETRWGGGSDLRIYHNGTDSLIHNTTGDLVIRADSFKVRIGDESEKLIDATANGSVALYYDNSKKFETTSSGIKVSGHIDIEDNYKLRVGTGDDLVIYHNGTDSYIDDVGTNNLKIRTDGPYIAINQTNGESMARFNTNGSVDLYYDNSKKLETTSDGVKVTGDFTVTGLGGGADFWWDNSGNQLTLTDDRKIRFGDSGDLQIYHDGTYNWIDAVNNHATILRAGTSTLYLQGSSVLIGKENAVEYSIKAISDGAAELYYDNALKLATTADGVNVSDESGSVHLRLYTGTSTLRGYLYADDNDRVYLLDGQGHSLLYGKKDAHTSLFYDGSQKFYTQSDKCVVAGHFYPETNNTYDLGHSSYRWANLYVNDMHFSNSPENTNSVDGTWGDWTLQEGEEDIFMINNRSGKKYKMALQEVV